VDCERLGVTFGLENGWTVINRAEQMVQMHQELAHPNLKLVYDVANATMVESPLDGLELVAKDLALVHVSDTDDKHWGHDRIGTGVIDFAAVTAKLQKIGYSGPTIMEIVDRRAPDESNRVSLESLRTLGWTT
jgi:sugar phosphate isomerase/epimerase